MIGTTALLSGQADGRNSAPARTGWNTKAPRAGTAAGSSTEGSKRIVIDVPAVCDATLKA